MSHSHSVASKSFAAVDRARQDVNGLKTHVAQLRRSDTAADQNMARQFEKHSQQYEALVEKAEGTVKRIKNVSRVPPRPTASAPAAVRAKRSLNVLLAGLGENKEGDDDGRNIKQKIEGSVSFLSTAGKGTATPLREDDFGNVLGKVAKATELSIARVGTRGVAFTCRNVFRAFLWFKDSENPGGIVPEHIGCFGIEETSASRWSCSRYAIFSVMTERANAAIRYFMSRETTTEEAFLSLARWLARHKTLFTSECDDRRLAFDASRGIFLPSCIYPFEGSGPPRFTRGSIPLRSNTSFASQPTVRVPGPTSTASGAPGQSGHGGDDTGGHGVGVGTRGGKGGSHPVQTSAGAAVVAKQGPGGIGVNVADVRIPVSKSRT